LIQTEHATRSDRALDLIVVAKVSMEEVEDELNRRLLRLFVGEAGGRRSSLRSDATIDDNLLFHEYLHGDTGEGLGASHQTGWTAIIANLLHDQGMVV
ncbi:hypothetical protein ACC710_36645, partial [Rhizobium ruizarguesonis]